MPFNFGRFRISKRTTAGVIGYVGAGAAYLAANPAIVATTAAKFGVGGAIAGGVALAFLPQFVKDCARLSAAVGAPDPAPPSTMVAPGVPSALPRPVLTELPTVLPHEVPRPIDPPGQLTTWTGPKGDA